MASHPEPRIPVIDVTSVRTRAIDGERAVVREIGDACRGIGFFYITGHGIAPEALARVFLLSRQFFSAPASLKNQARFSGPAANRGFISFGGETLDPGKPPDLKEAFNIGLELAAGDPDLLAGKPFRARNLWPDVPQFRTTMLDYFDRAWALGITLHRAFALDLGIDATFFDDKFKKPMATLRLLHYPPIDRPPMDATYIPFSTQWPSNTGSHAAVAACTKSLPSTASLGVLTDCTSRPSFSDMPRQNSRQCS